MHGYDKLRPEYTVLWLHKCRAPSTLLPCGVYVYFEVAGSRVWGSRWLVSACEVSILLPMKCSAAVGDLRPKETDLRVSSKHRDGCPNSRSVAESKMHIRDRLPEEEQARAPHSTAYARHRVS